MKPNLRPYQTDVVTRLRTSLARHRSSILCAHTGTGKTVIAKWISQATAEKGLRCLVAVHRRGLVDNLCQAFDKEPAVKYGVLMSGEDTAPGRAIQIASIDTLNSWGYQGKPFDLVIYDECHSHLPKLRTHLDSIGGESPPFVLGLSATPQCDGLSDVFRDIVLGPKAEWLQDNGYAARFRYRAGLKKGRLNELVKGGDEYTQESLAKAYEGLHGDFIQEWLREAKGRPTVGFFPRRDNARKAMVALQQAGVQAEYVDGETPDDERRMMFYHLAEGNIEYICNVGVIERGTDIPPVSCVQLCTSVGSLVRYRQMIGRGSRPSDGKEDCLVLDHGGNIARHGFWEDEIQWTLDRSEKPLRERADRPPVECPSCHVLYRGGRCKACGYEPTKRELRQQGLSFDGRPLAEVKREKTAKAAAEYPAEKFFTGLFFRGVKSGMTVNQVAAWSIREAQRAGRQGYRVPKCITVGGDLIPLPWGTSDAGRKCAAWWQDRKESMKR